MRIFIGHGAKNMFVLALCTDLDIDPLPRSFKTFFVELIERYKCDSCMIIGKSRDSFADCSMKVLERDYSCSIMCGNGIRTVALLLHILFQKTSFLIEVSGKILQTEILWSDRQHKGEVAVSLGGYNEHYTKHIGSYDAVFADVGEPHAIIEVEDISLADDIFSSHGESFVTQMHSFYDKEDTFNLNVVERSGENIAYVRTFERGVLRETKACGTGSSCCANFLRKKYSIEKDVHIIVPGGMLTVRPDSANTMEGPACIVTELFSYPTYDYTHKKLQRL